MKHSFSNRHKKASKFPVSDVNNRKKKSSGRTGWFILRTWLVIFISVETASARWLHVKMKSQLLPREVSLAAKWCGETPVAQPLLWWVIISHPTSPSQNSTVIQVKLLYIRAAAADWSMLRLCSHLQQQHRRVFSWPWKKCWGLPYKDAAQVGCLKKTGKLASLFPCVNCPEPSGKRAKKAMLTLCIVRRYYPLHIWICLLNLPGLYPWILNSLITMH